MKGTLIGLLVVLLLAGAAFTFPFEMRTDHAFICDTTGSRFGYTTWFFGGRSFKWYQKSALEDFISSHYPAEFQHRWKAYSHTGRDIFGRGIIFACPPRHPLLFLEPEIIAMYCSKVSDEEKLRTFRSLVRADREEAGQVADAILKRLSPEYSRRPRPQTMSTNLFE